ncbi:hypothetical protein K438DRAFT_1826069 [Mycena galopus ATCC 62051]|nr:hypothetical protein K438DRAFT_1826069 [Mycena galopus ATCC 62051]
MPPQAPAHPGYCNATPLDDPHRGNAPQQPGAPSIPVLENIPPRPFPNLSRASANGYDVNVDQNSFIAPTPTALHVLANPNRPDTHYLDETSRAMFGTLAHADYFDRSVDRSRDFWETVSTLVDRRTAAAPFGAIPRDFSSSSTSNTTIQPNGRFYKLDETLAVAPPQPQAPTHSGYYDATPLDDQHRGNDPQQPGVPSMPVLQNIPRRPFPNLSRASANGYDVSVDQNSFSAPTPMALHALANPMNGLDMHCLNDTLSQAILWTPAYANYFFDRLLDRRPDFWDGVLMLVRRTAAARPPFWALPHDFSSLSTSNPTIQPYERFNNLGETFPNASQSPPASSMASTRSYCRKKHSHVEKVRMVCSPYQAAPERHKNKWKPGLCACCGATKSPLWRRHPESGQQLCNKCGQRAHKGLSCTH